MAARYDINIDQGQTYDLLLTYKTAAGQVRDLTGCSVAMQIRTAPGAPVVLDMADVAGGLVIDPLDGRISISIPDEVTAGLAAGRYKYDLVIEFPNGKSRRLLEGSVKVVAGIARDGD